MKVRAENLSKMHKELCESDEYTDHYYCVEMSTKKESWQKIERNELFSTLDNGRTILNIYQTNSKKIVLKPL